MRFGRRKEGAFVKLAECASCASVEDIPLYFCSSEESIPTLDGTTTTSNDTRTRERNQQRPAPVHIPTKPSPLHMSPRSKSSRERRKRPNDPSASNVTTQPPSSLSTTTSSSSASHLPPLPTLSHGLPPLSLLHFEPPDEVPSNQNVHKAHWRNAPPRSNWNVPDNKLKPLPPLHPPPIVTQSTYIGDSSPSIIASRISECLTKRSVLAEYDDDDATATVVTPDGVSFVIEMHRGDKGHRIELTPRGGIDPYELTGGGTSSSNGLGIGGYGGTSGSSSAEGMEGSYHTAESIGVVTVRPDFTHGVLVECHRIRGCVLTFHQEVKMILNASRGECDGMEDHRHAMGALKLSPYGFNGKQGRGVVRNNLKRDHHAHDAAGCGVDMEWDIIPGLMELDQKRNRGSIPKSTCGALERILVLLEKKRWDAQCLGMKSLVLLTNVRSAGLERAYMAALCVLGSEMRFPSTSKVSTTMQSSALLLRIPERIKAILIGKFRSKRQEDIGIIDEGVDRLSSSARNPYQPLSVETSEMEAFHNAELRQLALQTITNVLSLVVYHSHEFPLLPKPSCHSLLSKDVLEAIAHDLGGATRPPMANMGTAHEATFACRFLHLLAAFSEEGYHRLSGLCVGTPPRPIIELLKRGRTAGLACHRALEVEASVACEGLNEHQH